MHEFNVIMNFSDRETSWQDSLREAKDIGFDGVEYGQDITEEAAAFLNGLGLKLVKTTVFPDENGSIPNAEILKSLGTKFAAINVPIRFGNHAQALDAAKKLNDLGNITGKYGIRVIYHNHTHEFRFDGGEYLLETVIKNTDPQNVAFCLDCGWAACAGVDVPAFIRKYPGRIGNLHLKSCTEALGPETVFFMGPDINGNEVRPDPQEMPGIIGKAQSTNGPMKDSIVNWADVLNAAEESGCSVWIVERERAYKEDIQACLKEDLEYLRGIKLKGE